MDESCRSFLSCSVKHVKIFFFISVITSPLNEETFINIIVAVKKRELLNMYINKTELYKFSK